MKDDPIVLLDSAGWPVLLADGTGTLLAANKAAAALFGFGEGEPLPPLSRIWSAENAHHSPEFLDGWERQPVPSIDLAFIDSAGHTTRSRTAISALFREGRTCFLLQLLPANSLAGDARAGDAESAHAQKQKLECALKLARTVALDFNNALTSILGHTSLIISKMASSDPWRASLLQIEKSAAKAAEIAEDLAAFSRQEKDLRPQAAGNINQVVQRTVEFMQRAPGNDAVQWRVTLERKLLAVRFDEAKLQQALIKIFENALEAVPPNGRITVLTRNFELSQPTQDRNVQLTPGSYVCIEIGDDGKGIRQEVLPRIFEPFFTTKGAGHRGLGLALVYGIVTNHAGGVAVSSQPGSGTSVRVYLPAEMRLVRDDVTTMTDLSGTETVLIVDDEELLLTMGQTVLSAYGYRVLTASSGREALQKLSCGDPVKLVITDLVMPAMSGRELIDKIHEKMPGMRVLCTSGYVRQPEGAAGHPYLQKPFNAQELLVRVRQALAE